MQVKMGVESKIRKTPKMDDENNGNPYKVGPLLVINGVITPISRVITPVTHL